MRTFRAVALLLLILLTASPAAGTLAMQTSELVFVQSGTMPILITAPHGGSAQVPGVPARTGIGVRAFSVEADTRTRELAEALLSRLETRFCQRPYAVIAYFHRRYIDANRVEAEAYEQPEARPHYLAYHEAIRGFVDELRGQYPQGAILVDIHGQGTGPNTIYRGTSNGRTVTGLVARQGPEALIGPNSIFGQLQASGFEVFPPNTPLESPREESAYNGGYTVLTYGSHRTNGIDAIQIEHGTNLRLPRNLDRLGQGLADAIATFSVAHLGNESRCA